MADNQALLLQVSADIRGLEKQFAKAQGIVDKSSKNMERRVQQTGTQLDRFFGQGTKGATEFTRALGNIKTASLQQLAPGADRYATALGHLGVAGVAAGLAIAGVAAAFKGAREAARFADDISDTANRLHVTTDALQEYRFAIRAAGGDEQGADEALEAFNVTLGKAQAGLPKALKAFKELGFTKAQVQSFTDADTALKAVVGRIAGLSDVQEDAVIQQLGLDGIKPLIEAGADEMVRLRQEAHKVGLVMDAELVKRGGELNDQFETVAKVIDIQVKSALVDLGPVLLDLLKGMAQLARLAADVADAFKSLENRRTETLLKNRESFQHRASGLLGKIIPGLAAHDEDRAAQALREIIQRTNGGSPRVGATRRLIDQSLSGGGGRASRSRSEGPTQEDLARARQIAELRDQIELARAAGSERASQDLEDELDRVRRIADLRKEGFDLATATANANAFIAQRAENRGLAESRNRSDPADFKPFENPDFAAPDLGPIQEYLASLQDLNTTMEEAGVNAARQLSDGLADAILGARSLGDVARSVFQQLASDILSATIQKSITGPLLSALALPAHASGTNFAPGGLSLVGERGPEIVNLPRGAQVIPNDVLRGLGRTNGGPSSSFAPTLNMVVHAGPGMTAADARRTGAQMGAAAMREMARARKAGIGG